MEAILFGWIGDHIGRRSLIFFTTGIITGIICITTALCPSYEKIGITASYIITSCRILQGLSSMGEIMGVRLLYLSESSTVLKNQFTMVAIPDCFCNLGSLIGLFGATFAIYAENHQIFPGGWRIIFFIGSCVAFIGAFARREIKETIACSNAKKILLNKNNGDKTVLNHPVFYKKIKINFKACVFYITISMSTWMGMIFFPLMYCSKISLDQGYSNMQITLQNIYITIWVIVLYIFFIILNYFTIL